jgi:hypothetical protein
MGPALFRQIEICAIARHSTTSAREFANTSSNLSSKRVLFFVAWEPKGLYSQNIILANMVRRKIPEGIENSVPAATPAHLLSPEAFTGTCRNRQDNET